MVYTRVGSLAEATMFIEKSTDKRGLSPIIIPYYYYSIIDISSIHVLLGMLTRYARSIQLYSARIETGY